MGTILHIERYIKHHAEVLRYVAIINFHLTFKL